LVARRRKKVGYHAENGRTEGRVAVLGLAVAPGNPHIPFG
jgi:hypothetical protein